MMASETNAPLLRISTLTKRFGGFSALDNVSVDIRPGNDSASSAQTVRARPR